MGPYPANTIELITRFVLSLVILTALMCSSGEGIRLLPFPGSTQDAGSLDLPEFSDDGPVQYDADRSENTESIARLKFGSLSSDHLHGTQNPYKWTLVELNESIAEHQRIRANSSECDGSTSSRGPPFKRI